jgi:hypothetical protein
MELKPAKLCTHRTYWSKGQGWLLGICIRQALINITASPSSPAEGAMYAPLALKSVYGSKLVLLRNQLNFSQSTRPFSQSYNNW